MSHRQYIHRQIQKTGHQLEAFLILAQSQPGREEIAITFSLYQSPPLLALGRRSMAVESYTKRDQVRQLLGASLQQAAPQREQQIKQSSTLVFGCTVS